MSVNFTTWASKKIFFTFFIEQLFVMHRLNSLYSKQRETRWTLTEPDHFPIFFHSNEEKKMTNFAVAILTEFIIFNFLVYRFYRLIAVYFFFWFLFRRKCTKNTTAVFFCIKVFSLWFQHWNHWICSLSKTFQNTFLLN